MYHLQQHLYAEKNTNFTQEALMKQTSKQLPTATAREPGGWVSDSQGRHVVSLNKPFSVRGFPGGA